MDDDLKKLWRINMRPKLKLLEDNLKMKIIAEARELHNVVHLVEYVGAWQPHGQTAQKYIPISGQ